MIVNNEYHHVRVVLHDAEGDDGRVEEFSDAMRVVGAVDVVESDTGIFSTLLPGEWRFPAQESVEATHDRVREIANPFCMYSSIMVLEFGNAHYSLDPIDHPGFK